MAHAALLRNVGSLRLLEVIRQRRDGERKDHGSFAVGDCNIDAGSVCRYDRKELFNINIDYKKTDRLRGLCAVDQTCVRNISIFCFGS